MTMNPLKIFRAQSNLLFVFSTHFLILTTHIESASYGTLNFERESNGLIDIEKSIKYGAPKIGYELATACPAQLPHEVDFNSNHSFGKNSLFVQNIYGTFANPKTIQDVCTEVYKMSISYNRSTEEIEFGYEVYYDSGRFAKFVDSNYDEYDPISMAYSRKRGLTSLFPGTSKPNLVLKTTMGESITLGFVWILMIRLKFDYSIKRPIQVVYTLSADTEMGAECKDYSLGDEVYKQVRADYMDSLYANQITHFKNTDIRGTGSDCEQFYQCLTKHSLVPAEEFRFRSPQPIHILCSNLTTVPLWKIRVEGVLKKLDKFLYALANVTYKPMKVLSGVHGHLAMPKNTGRGKRKISLGEIPVPNIIYKNIKYEFEAEEKKDGIDVQTPVKKAIVIVIYNDPLFNQSNTLCPKENCENWGWKEILYESISSQSGFSVSNVFCCPRSKQIVTKLGMKYDNQPTDKLDLKEFPVYYKRSKKLRIENIEQQVITKMVEMFDDGKSSKANRADALLNEESNKSGGEVETRQ